MVEMRESWISGTSQITQPRNGPWIKDDLNKHNMTICLRYECLLYTSISFKQLSKLEGVVVAYSDQMSHAWLNPKHKCPLNVWDVVGNTFSACNGWTTECYQTFQLPTKQNYKSDEQLVSNK